MKAIAKTTLELIGMALLITILCVISLACLRFLVPRNPRNPQVNSFSDLAKPEDVQIDQSGKVRYKGKPLSRPDELEYPGFPKGLKWRPNDTDSGSMLYLGNGIFLISGGFFESTGEKGEVFTPNTANLLFDEHTKQFQSLQPLLKGRWNHNLLRLANGNVLVIGGQLGNGYEPTIELIDMKRKSCSIVGQLAQGRVSPSLLELAPNSVLAVGGRDPEETIVELVDINCHSCKTLGRLLKPRWGATIFHTSGNEYLIVGGYNSLSEPDSNHLPAEIINVPER